MSDNSNANLDVTVTSSINDQILENPKPTDENIPQEKPSKVAKYVSYFTLAIFFMVAVN